MRKPAALATAIILSICALAPAQTVIKTTFGWGDAMRLGRWNPIFVTVDDIQVRSIRLQIQGTYGTGASLLIQQPITAQEFSKTFALLYPLNTDPSHASVIATDPDTRKTLAVDLIENPTAFTPAGHTPLRVVAADETLLGISGNLSDILPLQDSLARIHLPAGVLDESHLPATAVGYEGINALILAAPDLRDLDPSQQQAIVAWIRRGGNLLFIPGSDPLPAQGPIASALPCDIGPNQPFPLASTQPSPLNGRDLSLRPGSSPIQINLPDYQINWTAYTRPLGLGRITVLPADLSLVKIPNTLAVGFWRNILAGMVEVPDLPSTISIEVNDAQEDVMRPGPKMSDSIGRGPRETHAIRHALDFLNASHPNPQPNRSGLLLTAIALFALLGPADSILLMRLGRSPRHWLTLLAWIGLIATSIGYVAARPPTTDPHIQTLRLIDQADDTLIAATDIVSIESDRSRDLPLTLSDRQWWEPANQSASNFSANRFLQFDCHEDQTGCRPITLSLTAGDPQSLRGEVAATAPPLLEADLTLSHDPTGYTITGRLTNKSPSPMTALQIATAAGNCTLKNSIPPGAFMEINTPLTDQPISLAPLPADIQDIASDRTDRINALTKTPGYACVYCQLPDAPPPTVVDAIAPEKQSQLLRALFPLK